MVFSSPSFLFIFLPATLLIYFVLPPRLRNLFLLCASLVFYAYGEGWFTLLMLASIVMNWGMAFLMASRFSRSKKIFLALAVTLNLCLLCFFKYATFFVEEVNRFLAMWQITSLPVPHVHLPLGISFFTFQAMSYVIDCYRGTVTVEKNPFRVGLYITLFPQLIAGPIVRYGTVAAAIVRRHITTASFLWGLRRFVFGLAKKVLIANTLAVTVDRIFALPTSELTTPLAWLGTVCFIGQVYHDFSGYSDMAIGIGRMLGFRFRENFDYPYVGTSVREFWRRWHISLSTWFRDYLYIPLGGSRKGHFRTSLNLFLVFTLVGLWHGASWTYLLFGAIHGTLLALERVGLEPLLMRAGRIVGRLYFWIVIVFTFSLFRAKNLGHAFAFWRSLAGWGAPTGLQMEAVFSKAVLAALIVGAVIALPLYRWVMERLLALRWKCSAASRRSFENWTAILLTSWCLLLLLSAVAHGSMETYNPFVYFRF